MATMASCKRGYPSYYYMVWKAQLDYWKDCVWGTSLSYQNDNNIQDIPDTFEVGELVYT